MTKARSIAMGIELILSVEPDAECATNHDQFFCGTHTDQYPDVAAKLTELGWFEDEDSWSIFT